MAEDKLVLKTEKISKSFINPSGALLSTLQEIQMDLKKGELLTILGPSSSGKSTLLRIIAGIEKPDSGVVSFSRSPDLRENAAFIPTEPSSLPWLSVRENVRLGLREETAGAEERIKRAISLVGLDGYENHIPANKSTGFRFRISLARALAMAPKVILIDDALRDLKTERKMDYYALVREILNKEDVSILWVSSDITGALLISDRILLMAGKPSRIVKEFSIERKGILEAADLNKEEYCRIRKEIEILFYTGHP